MGVVWCAWRLRWTAVVLGVLVLAAAVGPRQCCLAQEEPPSTVPPLVTTTTSTTTATANTAEMLPTTDVPADDGTCTSCDIAQVLQGTCEPSPCLEIVFSSGCEMLSYAPAPASQTQQQAFAAAVQDLTMTFDLDAHNTYQDCGIPFMSEHTTVPWTAVTSLVINNLFTLTNPARLNLFLFTALCPLARSLAVHHSNIPFFLFGARFEFSLSAVAELHFEDFGVLTEVMFTQATPMLERLTLRNTACQSLAIAGAENLKHLDISSNGFLALPFDIVNLPALETIIAADNAVQTLELFIQQPVDDADNDDSSHTAPALATLVLSGNRLSSIERANLLAFPSLQHLDISRNDVSVLRAGIFDALPQLHTLLASHNRLRRVDEAAFQDNRLLRHLDVGFNVLSTITLNSVLSPITHLTLSHNLLQDLVVTPSYMSNNALVRLDARNNTLEHIPPGLTFPVLEYLDLNGNFILELDPDTFLGMPLLKSITLRRNHLTQLDRRTFRHNPLLTYVSISINELTTLDPAVFAHLHHVTFMEFHDNLIEEVSEDLFASMPLLEDVALDNNRLSHLPPRLFANNPALKNVVFSGNNLKAIPAGLFAAANELQRAFFNSNPIEALPERLFPDHPELLLLDISSTRVSLVPADFFQATPRLETLNCASSTLIQAPPLQHVPHLRTLSLDNTYIEQFDLSDLNSVPRIKAFSYSLRDDRHRATIVDSSGSFSFGATLELCVLSGSRFEMTQADIARMFQRVDKTLRLLALSLDFHTPQRDGASSATEVQMSRDLPFLCDALAADVTWFHVSAVPASIFELCNDISFRQVVLESNPQLEVFAHKSAIDTVIIRDADRLRMLQVPDIASLDFSGTPLPFNPALCTIHGHQSLVARSIQSQSFRSKNAIERLLEVCLSSGGHLDLSGNTFLGRYFTTIRKTVGKRFIFGEGGFEEATLTRQVPSRTTLPQFTLSDGPIRCVPKLAPEVVRAQSDRRLGVFPSVSVECSCAEGFTDTGSQCLPPAVDRSEVVGTALGASFGTLAIAALGAYIFLLFSQQKREKNFLFKRLLNKEDEVEQLKQAWNISHAEVHKEHKIAEGAQGEVWKGAFNHLEVAIKYFKNNGVEYLDEGALSEFQREMDFLREAKHANLVQFYGGGTELDGRPFLVLQYVPLGSLRDLLDYDLGSLLATTPFSTLAPGYHRRGAESTAKASPYGSTFVMVDYVSETSDTDYDGFSSNSRRFPEQIGWREMDSNASEKDGSRPVSQQAASFETSFGSEVATGRRGNEDHRNAQNELISAAVRKRFKGVWDLKVSLARDIARGMLYIHDKNRVHRDLKPQNVLISEGLIAKITDFGCIGERILEGGTGGGSGDDAAHFNLDEGDVAGTPLYMAPEVDSRIRPDLFRADVFSYGVVLWEIATQKIPDLVEQEYGSAGGRGPYMTLRHNLLEEGRTLRLPPETCDEGRALWYRDICLACMEYTPGKRPLFPSIESMFAEYAKQLQRQ